MQGAQVKDNLYFVEKILRIEEEPATEEGQPAKLFAVVKWEDFSYRDTTREPIENLKLNPNLKVDLEALEHKFKLRKEERSMELQTEVDIQSIRQKIFTKGSNVLNPQTDSKKTSALSEVRGKIAKRKREELVDGQLSLCFRQAEQRVKNRVEHGLASMTPLDYFRLLELWYDALQQAKRPQTRRGQYLEDTVKEVQGLYRHEDSYRFCLLLKGKVMTSSASQMLELFPHHLLNYISRFLKYMKAVMGPEILKIEQLTRAKRYKMKSVVEVNKVLNLTERIESTKHGVHFGTDAEDVKVNMERQRKYFQGLTQLDFAEKRSQPSRSSFEGSVSPHRKEKKKSKGVDFSKQITRLYNEIQAEVKDKLKSRSSSRSRGPSSSRKSSVFRQSASQGSKSKEKKKKRASKKEDNQVSRDNAKGKGRGSGRVGGYGKAKKVVEKSLKRKKEDDSWEKSDGSERFSSSGARRSLRLADLSDNSSKSPSKRFKHNEK